jgi:hypothetical protein
MGSLLKHMVKITFRRKPLVGRLPSFLGWPRWILGGGVVSSFRISVERGH